LTVLVNNSTNSDTFEELVKEFFTQNSSITNLFRYYTKRPYNVIKDHLYTALYFFDQTCVGYGHLDKDKDTIWLGLAVTPYEQSKGIGTKIMEDLLAKRSYQITLSVDRSNTKAIKLYKKFKFDIVDQHENYFIMKN